MQIFIMLFTQLVFALGPHFASPNNIAWSRGPDIPLPRGGYYAAWYKGGLLLAGGTYWKDNKKHWTDRVSFYNPALNEWSELQALPRPLAYGSMVEAQGNLYLIGGSDEKNIYQDIYRFSGEKWVRIGELPRALVYTASASVGSRIYVFGGGESVNDVTQATNSAWVFETKAGKWHTLEPTPGPPRVFHTVAVLSNHIYLFGGSTQKAGRDLENLNDVHRFNTTSRKWIALKQAPFAARAWWSTPADGYIYLFGGYSDRFLDEIYRYDQARDEYRLTSRLPLPLADTQFFYHKGVFYGAAGEDKMASRFSGTLIGRMQRKHRSP